MGNELEGDFSKLNGLVAGLKQKDGRHLYSTTTFSFQKGITGAPQREDEFYVTQWTKKGWIRGQGIFNDKAPAFNTDYSQAISDIPVPVISHEIGQYAVFPDISEIGEYSGNLQAKNFMAVKADLEKKGLLFLAPAYLKATGKFAAILYKEEIERALRTKGFDGFHLLQLQDFPGQGTALVGLLNAFWKSKGAITPEDFRQFCSEVVPLIRFPKAVYSNTETFQADVELANFFHPFNKARILWNIRDKQGVRLAEGEFAGNEFPIGNALPVGRIEFGLDKIKEAKKLTIEVIVKPGDVPARLGMIPVKQRVYHNTWNIWVYPAPVKDNQGEVVITQSFTSAVTALGEGKKVLLCPEPDTLKGIAGKFVPVFWSPVHFPDQPGTMGLLIKQGHKALSGFPTDLYSDWQWWDLAIKSKTMAVGALPDEAIIVRVIDNFVRNKNLANLFEVKMGAGRLLFSSIDIVNELDQRMQARQLRYSLLQYMNSPDFNPVHTMTMDQLRAFFK
jgi:hypothetical protein